jgi:aldose sugar dehydrogenase
MVKGLLASGVFAMLALTSCGSSDDVQNFPTVVGVETRVAATGLDHPWELVWGPDNWIWFTERGGNVGRLNPEDGVVQRIATISEVWQDGESGLLGMALHPDFPNTPHVFLAYTYDEENHKERVVRYDYNGMTLVDPVTLIDGIKANTFHDGCRLMIVGDKLFITTGDAGDQSAPQNKNTINGKILRLNLDGSIPSDNPIANNPIWSFGHRNPQGIVMASNGIMYSSEHGPSNDDEVNIIEKGNNYGWPNVQGMADQPSEQTFKNTNNTVDPIANWTPTLAVSGMTYYDKDLIPQWKNCLLMLTLKEQQLMVLDLSDDGRSIDSQAKAFDNEFGRLRGICVSPDGRVFFSTNDEGEDKVIEVKPAVAKRKATLNETSGLPLYDPAKASLLH